MTLNVRPRRRVYAPPQPTQGTMFRELDGELRLAHELFRRERKATFLDGITTPSERRARIRVELADIADERCKSKPELTLRQLFERTYREPFSQTQGD